MVRQEWLSSVVGRLQLEAEPLLFADVRRIERRVHECMSSVPPPTTPVETLVLRGVLVEFAWKLGKSFHGRFHRGDVKSCAFRPGPELQSFFASDCHDPVDAFKHWVTQYFHAFERSHPISIAERAAHLIERDFDRPIDVATLARQVRTSRSHLTRSFKARFGVSPAEFQRMMRLVVALERIRHDKVDAVSLGIGYRSKKNFYRAFMVTGMTPTGFRSLPEDRAMEIIRGLRTTLRLR